MDTEKLNSLNSMFDNIVKGRTPDTYYVHTGSVMPAPSVGQDVEAPPINAESVVLAPVYTPSVEQDANIPGNVENVKPLPAPEQPEQEEEKNPAQKAHEINAWKKYMGNTEETLLEAKKLVEGTSINENDFLGDDDCTKTVREYMEEKSRNADFKAVFQDDPAISKLVAEGKELPAAIAAHNLNDVKKQYDLIQTVKNQLRADEIRNQLNIMGTAEALGDKDIDWDKVKELQEEYKKVSDLPSITDDPVTAIIAGAAGQMPQMGRSAITALKYGAAGFIGGAAVGAAGGTVLPVVGNAVGATAMGVKGGSFLARVGWFKGSFDEMFGYNYLQLRSEKDDRGIETYSRDSARAYAAAQAAVSAGIENYNTGAILNYLGKGKGIATKEIKDIVMGAASKESALLALERFVKTSLPEFFKHVGGEVGEETLQSLSDDTIKNLSTITNKRAQGVGLGQMAKNAAENAIEAIPASIGLVGAGKIGSMPRAAKQAIRLLEIQNEQAKKDVHTANGIDLIGKLKEHINNSEFFKKSPEVASEVLAKNLEGSGFETVYVDTMALKEQEGGEQLIREAAEKAGKSEEEINSILANDTDFSVPTQTFLQTSLANDEKGKYCITFQNGADSFARKQIMAEAARSEMQIVTEIEAQQKAEAQDLIASENFAEGDRAEALRLMNQYEGGIITGINNEIKKLTAAAQAILNPYISEANNWSQQDMFSAMPIYDAKRKKWGIYTDFDGNMVNAANYDPALHGELEGWEFTEIARGPQWAENFRQIYGHFPNAFETRQALLDALEGNNGLDMLAGASEEEQEFRQAQAEEYRSAIEKVAQLNRIRDTFKNIGGDEAVITRGLSKEGYQVYKMAADAIKNAATPEAREAARYSAVILARHADAVARYVREAGKENYTALDYINDRVRIDPDGTGARGSKGTSQTLFQRVFHGTTAQSIERLLLKYVGSRKANYYGWGLYFGTKRTATAYAARSQRNEHIISSKLGTFVNDGGLWKNKISGVEIEKDSPLGVALMWLDRWQGNAEEVEDAPDADTIQVMYDDIVEVTPERKDVADKALALVNGSLKNHKFSLGKELHEGTMFEAEIPEDVDFYDWDKPVKEQKDTVKKALLQKGFDENALGEEVYYTLTEELGSQKAASLWLRENGVVGSKVLNTDEGMTYIVYDEDAIKYIDKFIRPSNEEIENNESYYDNEIQQEKDRWAHDEEIIRLSQEREQALSPLREELEKLCDEIGEKAHNFMIAREVQMSVYDSADEIGATETGYKEAIETAKQMLKDLDNKTLAEDIENLSFDDMNDVLYQAAETKETVRGQITFAAGKAVISLLQTADQSTFIHETGHLALADLKMLAEMEGAPEQILKDWQTVKEWLGYKDDQKDFTVKQQEQFARGFEAYLRSGEAPAAGLKKVFRKFKTWLTKIYSDFIQLGGEPSREVKDVMSRMLATQEEIELQMTRQHNSKFLRDGGLDFLAPSEQDVWVKWMQECQAEAEEKVMAEAMKDIKADQQERLKEYEDNIAQFRKMSQEELEQDEDWQKLMGIVAVLNETEKENHKEALAAFGYTLGKFDQAIYDRTGVTYSGQLIRSDNETTAEQFTELAVEHSLREQVEGYMQLQNEIAKENIKAMAKEAVASGEYADRLEEFMLGAVEKKRQAEERIGAFAEDKFAELEKELSGIDSKAEPEKVSKQIAALKQRIADLKYTIRWNKAEHNTAIEKLEKTVADLEKANASITSKASKTEERLNNKIASLQQEVKDLKGTIRWNEAENRIVFDIEKGRIKAKDQKKIDKLNEVIAGLNQEIAELKYNLRWNEAESKLMQEVAEGRERAREAREAKLNKYIDQLKSHIYDLREMRKQDLTGIRQVRDATRGFVQAVRQQANVVMDNAVIKDDILTDKTWERKAVYEGQMMLKEMSKRNWTEAAQHKRNQIIYAEYAKAARKRARALEKKTARLQQKMKSLKKYSQVSADYRYAFEKLMFDVGLSKRNPFEEGRRPDSYNGIQGVINSLREDGIALDEAFDWMDEFRPDDIVEFLESLRDYKDLTYSQFLSFERFMNMVYKAGRQEFVTNKDGQKVLASNVAAQIQQEAAENLETLEGAGERRINQKRDFLTNVARRARKLRAEIVQMETLLSQMGKTAHEYIYDRINDAALRELRASAEYTQRFKELLNSTLKDSKEFLDGKYQLNNEVFSGREVLAIALNWGTESNKQRVLDSWNLKESDVIELLSNLGDNEWAFVEGVWGMFDEMWPQMKAVQINITGGVPKRENAVAFNVIDKNNKVHEIKGGYYPIRYDSTQSVKAAQQVQINNLKAASGTNLSRNAGTGMMKERVARTQDMVLSTDINLIPSMINQNLHFIHMREAYLDASRLVKDGDFQKTVINTFGQDAYMELDRWLNDQWAPEPKVNDDLVWALKAARQNMTLGVLGFRMTTALINVANIATVSHYVGAANALRAIKNYYKHSLENGIFGVNPIRETILEKSVFMQERAATMDRDMRSVITDVNADNVTKLKAAQSEIIEKSFWFITQTDLMLALPLWQAEYERVYQEANIEGRTEEQIEADAIRAGDAAVRKCFGSGLRQDLNHYQRGGEIAKMFTTFYSYFAVIHNAVDRSFYESRRRYNKEYAGAPMGIKEWAKAAAPTISAIFWLYLMQSVLDAVTRQALNVAKGDDFDWEKFQKKTATNVVDNALGAVPLMREVAPRMMDAVLGERTNDFRIPFFDTANNLTKIWNNAADPKKDAAEVMYAIAEFTSRSTGISETALKAIPTTFRYLNNLERFSFQQYAGALLQAQTLKEHKKKK